MLSFPKSKWTLKVDWSNFQAVIFDVDGTLYNQQKLRFLILIELLKYYLIHPQEITDLKILRNFRRERERHALDLVLDLENAQYEWAATASGVPVEKVRDVVHRWMFTRPLKYLPTCQYLEVIALFDFLSNCGIKTGIFSDYPARDKIDALGLSPSCIVSSTDKAVGRLKPSPRGLFTVSEALNVSPKSCLFIGDRNDRDGECARRAQMHYLILKQGKPRYSSF